MKFIAIIAAAITWNSAFACISDKIDTPTMVVEGVENVKALQVQPGRSIKTFKSSDGTVYDLVNELCLALFLDQLQTVYAVVDKVEGEMQGPSSCGNYNQVIFRISGYRPAYFGATSARFNVFIPCPVKN